MEISCGRLHGLHLEEEVRKQDLDELDVTIEIDSGRDFAELEV